METYTERFAAIQARQREAPRREYLTKNEWTRCKSALTRAKNSGDPGRVLKAVEDAVELWNDKVWPDAWSTWRNALEDAAWDAKRQAALERDFEERDRLWELHDELLAASYILFP